MRCAALVVLVALTILLASRSAWTGTQSTLIVLVPPQTGAQSFQEMMNRVRGELAADGFDVLLVDSPVASADRAAVLSRAARDAGNDPLTIGLFVDSNASALELWLVDQITGKLVVRRAEMASDSPDQRPEVVARRTVDVLRASLLDLLVTSLRTVVSEASAGRVREPAAVEPEGIPRAGLEGGVGVLGSFGGVDPAILPLVRVRGLASRKFELRATGAWFGTRPAVRNAMGSATLDQGFALLECVAWLSKEQWPVRPLLSGGAGVYYAAVEGTAAPPYLGVRSTQLAFAMDAGFGAALRIARRLELIVEAHALITEPGIAVRFLAADAATAGRPSVLGTLTLGGWI